MKERFELTKREITIIRQYGLDPEKLQNCSACSYSFGERIVSEDLPSEQLFIVTGGRAKVGVNTPDGKSLILCFYISDGLMGEVELFTDAATGSTSVTALDHFECISIPIADNRNYLNNNLKFTHIAASELAKKLMQSTNNIVENTLYRAEVRLCRYIRSASDGRYFRDIMTDVAYSIGVSYRHLYRMMGALCRSGILEKTDSGYRICDMEKLTDLCRQK